MNVKESLKEYKEKECKIAFLKNQVNYLKKILQEKDIEKFHYQEEKKHSTAIVKRPTESQAINKDTSRKLTIHQIQEDIKQLESKLFILELEKENIDILLKSLSEIELYIVECRYFYKMTFDCILTNMQSNKFKKTKLWCKSTIFKMNKEAVKKMQYIAEENYILKYI